MIMSRFKNIMITCFVCNKEYKKIEIQHLRKHGHSIESYLEQFPDAKVGYSEELTKRVSGHTRIHSAETKRRISETLKKNTVPRTEKQREASKRNARIMVQSITGKKHTTPRTDEYKEKLSDSLKKYYNENPRGKMTGEKLIKQQQAVQRGADLKKNQTVQSYKDKIKEWGTIIDSINHMIKIQCNTCNNIIDAQKQTIRKHKFAETLCHKCHPPLNGTSKAEQEVNNFILSLGIETQLHNKELLGNGLEMDIYIPALKIGIEFNGLYWHCTKMGYDINKHKLKTDLSVAKGIRLIQIFEDEWNDKQYLIKSMLGEILRTTELLKIPASDTTLVELTDHDARSYLNEWHILGGEVTSSYRYGLKYNDEIVACMTFIKPRVAKKHKHEQGVYELLRFAHKPNLQIVGGADKLLDWFLRQHDPIRIDGYIDRRFDSESSNVFTGLGFVLIKSINKEFYYTDFVKRYNKYRFRKQKDCPVGLTEEMYWAERGYYRIYDCGRLLYSLSL